MRRVVTVVIALAAAVLLSALAAPAPSSADPENIDGAVGLSLDGTHWSSTLSRPLFDPSTRWVPGDVEARSFWVRDQGPTGARLTIGVVSSDADRLMADDDVTVRARVAGGAWVRLRNGRPSRRLTTESLQRGATRRVEVQARFAWGSPNRSQVRMLPFHFVVTLTQSVAGENIGDGGDHHHDVPGGHHGDGHGVLGQILSDTGAAVRPWMLWLAASLIGTGLALLAARRRDSSDKELHHG